MNLSLRAGRLIVAPALLTAFVLPSTASANLPGNFWAATAPGVCGTPGNTFTVPEGVTQIHVGAAGADGSASPFMSMLFGRSAVVQADLNVTPGQQLYACLDIGGGAGGGNGAGAGGGFGSIANGSDGSDPILVAGGGGGAGGAGSGGVIAIGGDATLPGGSPGHGVNTLTLNGGNSASGSAAGTGGSHPSDFTYDGDDGNGSAGGTGGIATMGSGGGGGGGGGSFGGGGGAGSADGSSNGAGGGGGSSFCALTCTSALRSVLSMVTSPAAVNIAWTAAPAMHVSGDGDFGDVKLGETVTRTYTVKSTGTAPLDLTMFGVTGGDPDFGFGAYTCGSTLAPGDECTVDITFTPTTAGTHTGTFTAGANGIASGTLALTANGVTPPSDPTPPTSTDTGTGTTTTAPPAPQTITPTPTACVSRRVVDVSVPGIYRRALVSAKAQIAGKTVANLKNGKGQIDLRGRTAGKVKVTLVIKLRGGRTRTDVRTYTTCGK